jgi:hypothetical protein
MAWRLTHRGLAAFVLATLVGCGGSTYGGLGGDLEDSGDDVGADAIFPTDDGSLTDSTVDVGADVAKDDGVDSTIVDAAADSTPIDDAADAGETAIDDSAAVDSTVDAADTLVDDTLVPDTLVADSAPDSVATDTLVGDSTVTDAADGSVDAYEASVDAADSTVTDSAPTDTGVVDSGTPDTVVVDTAPEAGLISTNPNKVYCGNTAGLLCTTGQHCCGALSGSNWSYTCAGSCGLLQRDFECNEAADCTGSKICCGGHPLLSSAYDGSNCRTSCNWGEDQLCMTDAECGAGHHCQAAKTADASSQTIGECK